MNLGKQRFVKSFTPYAVHRRDWLCEYIRRTALEAKGLFDSGHDLVMVHQVPTPGGGSAILNGFNETGIVFKHAVNGFDDEL